MTPSRSTLLLLFLALFGLFGFTAHGYLENADADVTMHGARALYERGDAGLLAEGEGTWFGERAVVGAIRAGNYGMVGANGKHYVWFPIGHQLLMVPFLAVGDVLAEAYPEIDEAYRKRNGAVFGEFFWSRFCISFIPAFAGAASGVMLLLIALSLGCSGGQALLVTVVTMLCTQFWPGASETLSNAPGLFFLLAMTALVFRLRAGHGGAGSMVLAGLCGGWAVLIRYPLAMPVLILSLVVLQRAWRERRWPWVIGLAAGALPEVAVLLIANWLRFGNFTQTGYEAGANADWWGYPLGVPSTLIAPGKGILLFSPPLLLGLWYVVRAGVLRFPAVVVLSAFALSLGVFGMTAGWAAGQCWSVRYMTAPVVLVCVVGFALGKPWLHRPRTFWAVCLLGFAVSLGGVITPYRGHQQLAFKAAEVMYPGAKQVDNNVNAAPNLSPIHSHWTYAWLSATGRLEEGGEANTIEPLFGVAGHPKPESARLSRPGEDAGFRHWWMVFLAHHHDFPLLPFASLWWLATAAAWFVVVRRLVRRPPEGAPAPDPGVVAAS